MDFSPEWDYNTGGSKIIICFKPSLDDNYEDIEQYFSLRFDEIDVPVKLIQKGVLKCNCPPHQVGFVNINLVYRGRVLTFSEEKYLFEYRENLALMRQKKVYVRQADDNDFFLEGQSR